MLLPMKLCVPSPEFPPTLIFMLLAFGTILFSLAMWTSLALAWKRGDFKAKPPLSSSCSYHELERPQDPWKDRNENEMRRVRSEHMFSKLTLFYQDGSVAHGALEETKQEEIDDRSLCLLRGQGQFVFDSRGKRYLDCVNNVAHIGHSHPALAKAALLQLQAINTNMRYRHPGRSRYVKKLLRLFTPTLDTVFFVNSGSEANDLALALARAYTGHEDVVVLDSAYHGHTTTMIDMSPYKHKGARPASHLNSAAAKEGQELKEIPDGQFPLPRHSTPCLPSSKDWVHVVPMPDTYRGRFSTAADYVNHSMALLEPSTASASHDLTAPNSLSNRGVRKIAAFFAESVLACGGQVVLPPGYLSGMYEYIHSKGGLCVADEVQTGFGRSGSHMWAFQSQDVVPDIVTLGKPIANAFPLAAVITRKEIAESLPISYFNTFGGSNLAVALGEATLDVILGDNLQEKAARLGALLKNLFESLKKKHSLVGDVRGLGMMLGVELVEDRETKAPAPAAAAYVLERARQMGVHIQVDGKWENVLKMKPPLAFMEEDAQTLVKTIDIALAEYAQRMGEMNGE